MGKFKDLKVWEEAMELTSAIYQLTEKGRLKTDFGLKNQMQRAAVSIASNIAEGDELNTNKQAIQFFYIAKGSAAELQTQLLIAHNIEYISVEDLQILEDKCKKIRAMLNGLIKVRSALTK